MNTPAPAFRLLLLIAAAIGLLAIVANVHWGMDYRNTVLMGSKPITAATYLKARPFDALALLGYAQNPEYQATISTPELTLLAASRLAPNDVDVVKALAAQALQSGDKLESLNQVARWASISPENRASAFSILLSAAGSREWAGFIEGQLKTNWPLAEALLNVACSKLGGNQLLALAGAVSRSAPISSQTVACVSTKLIAENRSPDARAFWLATLHPLPPVIGHVFNGDFALPVGNSPFNWSLAEGGEFRDGFRVALTNRAASDRKAHALVVQFNGRRVNSAVATQSLALPRGSYRLRYATKQSGFVGTESARWILRCGITDTVIEQQPEPSAAIADGWSKRSGLFTITDACAGQTIRLELSSRLLQLTGTRANAAFADVVVERIRI